MPATPDLDFFLKTKNPFKNQDGLYPNWSDVLNGTNWATQQRAKAANTPVIPSLNLGSTTTGTSGGRYSTLRLTKNPALEALGTNILGRTQTNSSGNYADLGKYLGLVGQAGKANAGDQDQENSFISGAFDGTLADRLAAARTAFGNTQRDSITAAGAELGSARDRFHTAATADIAKLQSDLATQRAAYEGRSVGDINNEVARRDADLLGYTRAAQRATDLSIGQANRANKAMFMQAGTGGSSYTNRLGIGARVAANTALQERLAAIRAANTERELARRAGLTDNLTGFERGEITGAGTARLGLTGQVANQERSDLGYTLGREDSLNNQLYGAERGDVQYVQDQAGRFIGVRRNQRNATATDALLPITARNSIQGMDLESAARLGAIDQSNNFYGIDDGTGDSLRYPRIPNYSLRRPASFPDAGGYGGFDDRMLGAPAPLRSVSAPESIGSNGVDELGRRYVVNSYGARSYITPSNTAAQDYYENPERYAPRPLGTPRPSSGYVQNADGTYRALGTTPSDLERQAPWLFDPEKMDAMSAYYE